MSDRTLVIDMASSERRKGSERVLLFMDGESGTWRLFVENPEDNPHGQCVDFSLSRLRSFRDKLTDVLADIERDPDAFNAETRKARESLEGV